MWYNPNTDRTSINKGILTVESFSVVIFWYLFINSPPIFYIIIEIPVITNLEAAWLILFINPNEPIILNYLPLTKFLQY
jgi:hypothetical protein